MYLIPDLRIRIRCKRTHRGTECGGIFDSSIKELMDTPYLTAACPNCNKEFSEGRTVFVQGECLKTLAKLLYIASSWNFEIELLETSH